MARFYYKLLLMETWEFSNVIAVSVGEYFAYQYTYMLSSEHLSC